MLPSLVATLVPESQSLLLFLRHPIFVRLVLRSAVSSPVCRCCLLTQPYGTVLSLDTCGSVVFNLTSAGTLLLSSALVAAIAVAL